MKKLLCFLSLAAMASWGGSMAWADVSYDASLDTSALAGLGTYSIDFQFIDGTGAPTDLNNNTVTISNFGFGTRAPSGSPFLFGGASGDLSSSVVLSDTQFFNEFTQDFTPGNTLTFHLDLTTGLNPSGVPDELSFAILDSLGDEVPTTGPVSEFFSITIDSTNPIPLTYASSDGSVPAPSLEAPSVSDVPEPGSAGFLAIVLVLIGQRIRRKTPASF